ncbi:hypothetical protein Spla01_02594 [Streptomyces platensis]|uniref:CdiI immunity protein domain-containing protein n=1 Tax=Streptomyces platensis TaxID=58346 RepID=A0ABX3XVF1_STRPT|nr:hypothetical protein [Streptomyces platensis]OSY44794.1 hypothetical protein BG653_03817 [Streptomyces platensis]
MSFPETVIPHYASDRRVAGFFSGALNVEFIDDIHTMKPGAVGKTPYARHLKEALEHLLSERPAGSTDWALMTGVSFWEDDRLYSYLKDLYDYFYGDREEPPVAPDAEAPPPEKYWR